MLLLLDVNGQIQLEEQNERVIGMLDRAWILWRVGIEASHIRFGAIPRCTTGAMSGLRDRPGLSVWVDLESSYQSGPLDISAILYRRFSGLYNPAIFFTESSAKGESP